jgi:predicted metal-dependent peptidase
VFFDPTEHQRVTQARTHLVLHHPFFGALALRLKLQSWPCGTADVDGVTLRYDPQFTGRLPFAKLVGLMAHEVMHCGCGHHARRGNRDPSEWNISCDLAINPLLIAAGLELPEGALLDPSMVDDQGLPLSAEVIYTRRQQPRPQAQEEESEEQEQRQGEGSQGAADEDDDSQQQPAEQDEAEGGEAGGPDEEPVGNFGGCGSFRDAPVDAGESFSTAQTEAAQDWDIATMQAVAAAKAAGDIPGAAQWIVDKGREPRVDWREVLRDFVQVRVRSEATWSRPNRRYIHQGTYLPSRDSRELGELVVITDASGSCWGPLQDAFAAELNAIVEDLRPRLTHVVYWDTRCQGHEEVEADDLPLTLEARGGGGTVFRGIWPWIEEQGIDPACVVVLTDLDLYSFGDEPAYPVLWCSTYKTLAPFGEVVQLTL